MGDKEMNRDSASTGIDDIGQLIRYAGEREQVSSERMENARSRVGDHWQGIVAEKHRSRRHMSVQRMAIAASLVVALGIGFILTRPASSPDVLQVAAVDRVLGDVVIDGAPIEAGDTVAPGAIIETGIGGRLAIRLEAGQSLRVDSESRLVARSESIYVLESGLVYFDSNLVESAEPIFIETPFGLATDVGTQYLVHVTSGFLTVGVREGAVQLDTESEAGVLIHDGSLFKVDGNGDTHRGDLSATDPTWDWTASVTPNFDIEGVSLRTYLEWYARQLGLGLEWSDEKSRRHAENTALSGTIKGLTLEDGFDTVRQIAPFDFERSSGGTLTITAG